MQGKFLDQIRRLGIFLLRKQNKQGKTLKLDALLYFSFWLLLFLCQGASFTTTKLIKEHFLRTQLIKE